MNKIIQNFKVIIIVKALLIISLLTIALIYIYFFSNQIKMINTGLLERKEMDYQISNQAAINSKMRQELSQIDPEYQTKILSSLPSVYNILDFVDNMENLAKKHSFQQSLNFSPPIDVPEISGPISIKAINFNLVINETNIENFIDYLNAFENLPYFVTITSITHTSVSPDGLQKKSSINITGILYAKQ